MPITADQVTIAQYVEPEALVDLVTEATVNVGAEVLLATPVGQNDNRMSKASFAQWLLQTGTIGGALTGTPGASSYVVSNGTGSDAAIGLVVASGNAGLMSGADKAKLNGVADGANAYVHPDHTGHISSSGDGSTTIQPDVIATAMVQNDAITAVKLADGTTNVLKWGADPTGVGDSTSAFNTALATGLNVYVPTGTYRIASTLSMAKGQCMYGDGSYLSQLTSTITDGTPTVQSAGNQWVELRDLSIWGATTSTGGQNTTAVDFSSAPRCQIRNVHTRYCVTGFNLFDCWLLMGSELWVRECSVGFKLQQFNGAEMQVKVENCSQSFSILSSFGSTIELMHEGAPQTTTSTIDACNAITFANYYSEWTTDATVPDITIGGTSRARNISFANVYRTQRTAQVPMLALNDVDGIWIDRGMHRSKTGASYGLSNIYSTTALSRNVNCSVLPYTDDATTRTEMIPPVTWSNHYVHNYYPDPKMLSGLHQFDLLRNCSAAINTTDVAPGMTKSLQLTITSTGTTVYAQKLLDLTQPPYDALRGQIIGVGAQVKTPVGANWPGDATERIAIVIIDDTGNVAEDLVADYVPGQWSTIRNTGTISNTTDTLELRFYSNNSATDNLNGEIVLWGALSLWIGGDFNSARYWQGQLSGLGINEYPAKAQSLLINNETSTAPAAAADSTDVATDVVGVGVNLLGFDATGSIKKYDALSTGGSRKDGVDDLGTQSGSTYTIDFDAGTYDNKEIELGNSIGITLSATRAGRYSVRFKQDVTGQRFVSLVATNVSPWLTMLPLNTEPEAITVFDFEYQHDAVDNTKKIWHW